MQRYEASTVISVDVGADFQQYLASAKVVVSCGQVQWRRITPLWITTVDIAQTTQALYANFVTLPAP